MKLKSLLFMLVLLLSFPSFAQKFKVTGVVKDINSGETLPGVNVMIKGVKRGVITDIEGRFVIKTPNPSSTLVFSFIGYKRKSVAVKGRSVLDVALETMTTELDETVVIGYGSIKKSDLSGSVSSVKSEELNNTPNPDVVSALQGKVAGVFIETSEGGPGASLNVNIRSGNSIGASSAPLYVVDGFPIDDSPVGMKTGIPGNDNQNPLGNIDPATIESVEVLKDASSTAIYGARGANGVILITTKSGKAGKNEITVNAKYGVRRIDRRLDLMNSLEHAEYNRYWKEFNKTNTAPDSLLNTDPTFHGFWKGIRENPNFPNAEAYRDTINPNRIDTDWQDELYGIGKTQNYGVGFSGGVKKFKYNAYTSYFENTGIIPNNDLKRYLADVKLKLEFGKLAVDFLEKTSYTETNGVDTKHNGSEVSAGVVKQVVNASPSRKVDYLPGELVNEDTGEELSDLRNPYRFAVDVTNKSKVLQSISSVGLKYSFTKHFYYKLSLGGSINSVKSEAFYPTTTAMGKSRKGLAKLQTKLNVKGVHTSQLNYANTFAKKHSLNLMGAFSTEKYYSENFGVESKVFGINELNTANISVGLLPGTPYSGKVDGGLVSYIGRMNYVYNDKYIITGSIRADGASRFGAGNKWGYFPSGAFAWRINQENFLKNAKFLSNWKLRVSYGQTGNQRVSNYESLTNTGFDNYSFNGRIVTGLYVKNLANPELKWQTSEQTNLGMDLGFNDGKISIVMDVYRKMDRDILQYVSLPTHIGFERMRQNFGCVENRGVEFSLSTVNVQTKNFQWTTDFNISRNENIIRELGYGQNSLINGNSIKLVDKMSGTFYGFKQVGIIENEEELKAYRNGKFRGVMKVGQRKLADVDKRGSVYAEDGTPIKVVIDDRDRVVLGNNQADFHGGLINTFRVGNFSLGVRFRFKYGGEIYNEMKTKLEGYDKPTDNRLNSALDFWRPEVKAADGTIIDAGNPDSFQPVPGVRNMRGLIDTYVEDGSYIRLSSVNIGYNFPRKLVKSMSLSGLSVYFKGENLYTWTNYSGYDPEVRNIDKGNYPKTMNFTAGINIKF
ncbi:TonB-dependent receptor [Halosquirtibacter xylanolyticus]|uniref:SusC/RagA family TonB-linked outer membrane protein n=1 Tax=Halosquirtibacter xylanolyticus TaxID=3374599 RepID=UPI00374A1AB5|nr:TonB-dependent receptor [Prolixibacteraceae bacterium]